MATICGNGIDTGFVDYGAVQAAVLGLVQGVTEVLPVSAAAHMRVLPALFGGQDPGPTFAAIGQLGVALATFAFLWREVLRLAVGGFTAVKGGDYRSFEFRLLVGVAVASLPYAVATLALRRWLAPCGSPHDELWAIGAGAVGLAVLLVLVAALARGTRDFEAVRLRDAVVIGLAHVAAVVPGVGRSGAALTAALAMNLDRASAVRFSFLAGLPVMLGIGLSGLKVLRAAALSAHAWQTVGIVLAAATIGAYAAIRLLVWALGKVSVWPFAGWRVLVGGLLMLAATLDVFG